MKVTRILRRALLAIALACAVFVCLGTQSSTVETPPDRQEVVFWHFWGGADRQVVADVVSRFNASQQQYFVREIAMPGNNLDLKLFLSVAGGDPPDVVNQDDPIVADWAVRGGLTPLEELASASEIQQVKRWLFPAARRLGEFNGRLYALCNGLDIRLLYYNQTILDEYGLTPPKTLDDLDHITERTSLVNEQGRRLRFGYVPDPRRLWAWGVVFGGDFYDEVTGTITADDPRIVAALAWMTSYRSKYGAEQVRAFRQGDQSLPGKTFPLLGGRYTIVMDGQWRVRDINAFIEAQREAEQPAPKFGVCPLPPPPGGRSDAGWVNGNYFVVPRGARCPQGAWEFMKFWCGLQSPREAAKTCIAGGWIPVSAQVVEQPIFQDYLKQQPLFARFVRAAAAEHQTPIPLIPGASYFDRYIRTAGELSMYDPHSPSPQKLLQGVTRRMQSRIDAYSNDSSDYQRARE